jgi:hypothetical protein
MLSGYNNETRAIMIIIVIFYVAAGSTALYSQTEIERVDVLTAIEALSHADKYMESEYDEFNLTKIWHMYIEPDDILGGSWRLTYVVNSSNNFTFIDIGVAPNGTVYPKSKTYELDKLLKGWYPIDLRGFESGLIRIDSDEAIGIMLEKMHNDTMPIFIDYFRIRLEGSLSRPATPIWIGTFGHYYCIKLNATSGEVIDSYYKYNTNWTYTKFENASNSFDGTNFTALEGLNLSNYFMSREYDNFTLSSIVPHGSNDTGHSNSWHYRYVVNNYTNKVIHEWVRVHANGTVQSSNVIYEMEDLRRGIYCGHLDANGFSVDLVKIDSDEATDILRSYVQNDTWWDIKEYFSIYLLHRNQYNYSGDFRPIWYISFSWHHQPDHNARHRYIIDATTGEIVSEYHYEYP